jgi:hypothetical protein
MATTRTVDTVVNDSEGANLVSTNVWHIEHRQELLILYGKVSVRWAAIDLMLVDILAVELNNRAAAHALIFKSGAGKSRFEVFKDAIGESRFDQVDRVRILSIMRSITSLMATRNDIIHAPLVTVYSIEGKKITSTLSKIDRKQGRTQPVLIRRIEDHVNAVGKLLDDLEPMAADLNMKYGSSECDCGDETDPAVA